MAKGITAGAAMKEARTAGGTTVFVGGALYFEGAFAFEHAFLGDHAPHVVGDDGVLAIGALGGMVGFSVSLE